LQWMSTLLPRGVRKGAVAAQGSGGAVPSGRHRAGTLCTASKRRPGLPSDAVAPVVVGDRVADDNNWAGPQPLQVRWRWARLCGDRLAFLLASHLQEQCEEDKVRRVARWARPLVTLCALGLATGTLAACGGDGGSVGGSERELRLAVGGESEEGYDPTLGWGRYGSPLFQSTLLKRNPDLSISADLATDYEVSDDALTWTVDIRTDATFTDGSPVTTEDV